ncbi:MAG: hypothetical protein QOE92_687 [Chloroflexota bacterium]|jgi:hypothetical protein|nr:hypothetical protein [Chloroflexota bacterium]
MWLARAGALITLVVDAGYLRLLNEQGGPGEETLRVPFVAGTIAAMALLALLGSLRPLERLRPVLLAVSFAGLAVMGALAIFSIGLALLLAALPIGLAMLRSTLRPSWAPHLLQGAAGTLLGLAVVVGGFEATEIPTSCPPRGSGGGGGSSLLSGPYVYTCSNGKLTVSHPGCNATSTSFASDGTVTTTCQ